MLFAQRVKELTEQTGETNLRAIPRAELADAIRTSYPNLAEADPRVVSSHLSSNLKSAGFWKIIRAEAVPADVELARVKEQLKNVMRIVQQSLETIARIRE